VQWIIQQLINMNPNKLNDKYLFIQALSFYIYLGWVIFKLVVIFKFRSSTRKFFKKLQRDDKDIDHNLQIKMIDQINKYVIQQDEKSLRYFYPSEIFKSWKQYFNNFKANPQFYPDIYDYFSLSKISSHYSAKKFIDVLPVFFVSLGILGTFIGLTAGIKDLNPQGDSGELLSSINLLLNGMNVAFLTSIYGIIFSLIVQLINKLIYYPLISKCIYEIIQYYEEVLPSKEEGSILEELLRVQKEQMEDLKSFLSDELISQWMNGIKDAFNSTLSPHMEKTNAIIENLADKTAETQSERLNQMVNYFVHSLEDITGDQMRAFGETLNKTIQWHEKVYNEMNTLVSELNTSAAKQTEMVEKTTLLTAQMQDFGDQLANYQESFKDTVSELGEVADKNKDLQKETINLIETVVEERKLFTEHFSQQMNLLKENIQELIGQSELMKGLELEFKSFMQDFHETADLIKQVTVNNFELTKSLGEHTTKTLASNEQLNAIIEKLEDHINSYQHISENLNSIYNLITNERENYDQITTKQLESLKEYTDLMNATIQEIKQTIIGSMQQLNRTSEIFSDVNETLDGSMEAFANHMHQGLNRTFDQFDKQLSEAVSYLDRGVNYLRNLIEDMADGVSNLEQQMSRFNKILVEAAAQKE